MIYAVIHENRILGLYLRRDDAKAAARDAATDGVPSKEARWLYEEPGTERCEVIYRADRRRRWNRSGFYVDAIQEPS